MLVLEGAHRHDLLGDEGGVLGVSGCAVGTSTSVGAGERQAPHRFRELHVVADQQADLQPAELDDRRRRVAGREQRALVVAVELAFAVDRRAGRPASTKHGGIVDRARRRARRSRRRWRCRASPPSPRAPATCGAVGRLGEVADRVAGAIAGRAPAPARPEASAPRRLRLAPPPRRSWRDWRRRRPACATIWKAARRISSPSTPRRRAAAAGRRSARPARRSSAAKATKTTVTAAMVGV